MNQNSIERPAATSEGLKRVFPAKCVPFGGLNNEK